MDLNTSLSASLNLVGISAARGIDLAMQRDQVKAGTTGNGGNVGTAQLSPAQQRQVDDLTQIDRRVREHEQAHINAGRGVVTSGATYTYTYGPDGKSYAVGGEVGIDTSAANKAQANIDKGKAIQAAALAPRDPSPQDYRVAAVGGRLEAGGRADLVLEQRQQGASSGEPTKAGTAATTSPPTPAANRVSQAYGATDVGSGSASLVNLFA